MVRTGMKYVSVFVSMNEKERWHRVVDYLVDQGIIHDKMFAMKPGFDLMLTRLETAAQAEGMILAPPIPSAIPAENKTSPEEVLNAS